MSIKSISPGQDGALGFLRETPHPSYDIIDPLFICSWVIHVP
jgi:hypothetical protein